MRSRFTNQIRTSSEEMKPMTHQPEELAQTSFAGLKPNADAITEKVKIGTATPASSKATTCTSGDRTGWRKYFVAAAIKTLKRREAEMKARDKCKRLCGRFATTIATLVCGLFLFTAAARANTFVVTNTDDIGAGSLRQAILDANANPGSDTISFNIPGSGVRTISPTSALPKITDPVIIDGYTQPGASANTLAVGSDAVLLIELSGATANATAGLTISAGNSTIRGLVINRFNSRGIELQINGSNTIAGNFIGTNASGTANFPAPNNGSGILIRTPNNTIGGMTPADRNVLSGNGNANGGTGLYVDTVSATGNKIIGNYIGTNASGMLPVGNNNCGIILSDAGSNVIGGTTAAERNVISGNSSYGISIGGGASNNQITGNFIGSKADGTGSFFGNGTGISFSNSASGNTIGGTASGAGNLIAFNTGMGVFVGSTSINNAILGNSIYNNPNQLGIDLYSGAYGVTPNDNNTGDADTGANNLQNFPVIKSVLSNGGITTIQGTLDSAFGTQFRIELFSNDTCDPTGFGQGQNYLGFTNVTTDANGQGSFTFNVPTANVVGGFFTTTATDPNGNTSEFSACASGVVSSPGTLQFSTSFIGQLENSGSFTINVTRTNGSAGTVTVHYATADNTATAPADYTSTSGTLTFNDGETSKSITVPIVDDSLPEGSESFKISLTNPTGGAVLGGLATATMSMQDNDYPSVSINDVSQAETNSGTTAFTFTVTSSNSINNDVYVNYATADGTATAGSDYQSTSGTLIIPSGQTSKTITVLVNGDPTQESDETFFVNLSNPADSTIAKAKGVGTIINDDGVAPASVQFSAANYSVQEDLGALTITVTRTGNTSGAASVDYTTNDGVATQKGDFEFATGRLNFVPGDTSKTFQVLLNEDLYLEGNETFGLTLSNVNGASLGAQSTATVTISDDAPESVTNPIDDSQSFVYMQYHDFLNREPDQAGLAFWTNEIASCGSDQQCIDAKRANVSAAFYLSIEFQSTGYLVYRTYKAAYGNLPGAPVPIHFNEFVRDTHEVGDGVVVNQPGWVQLLENNKQAFMADFVQRPQFTLAYPTSMTPMEFVDALSTNAGIVLSPGDRLAAMNEFAGSPSSIDTAARARALRDVAETPALPSRNSTGHLS